MLVEQTITKDGRTLNLASSESAGPPLLFLHGVVRRWQDWISLAPALSCRWKIHALDFRGHGRSGRTSDLYLVRDYLQDALAVIDQVCAEPVVLFGHSLGSLVALGAAACLPGRVRGVILEDPPSARVLANLKQTPYYAQFVAMRELAGSTLSVGELTRRLVEIPIPTPKGTIRLGDMRDATSLRFSARCLQLLDPRVLAPIIEGRWLEDIQLEEWASQAACPVLLLRGNETAGGMLPKADAEAWFRQTRDLTQIDLSNVGHLIHAMDPQITLRLVTGFLESLR